jgi:hypothetical protein
VIIYGILLNILQMSIASALVFVSTIPLCEAANLGEIQDAHGVGVSAPSLHAICRIVNPINSSYELPCFVVNAVFNNVIYSFKEPLSFQLLEHHVHTPTFEFLSMRRKPREAQRQLQTSRGASHCAPNNVGHSASESQELNNKWLRSFSSAIKSLSAEIPILGTKSQHGFAQLWPRYAPPHLTNRLSPHSTQLSDFCAQTARCYTTAGTETSRRFQRRVSYS